MWRRRKNQHRQSQRLKNRRPTSRRPPKKAQDNLAAQVNKLVKDEQKRKQAATGVLQNLAKVKSQAEEAEKKRKEQERKQVV